MYINCIQSLQRDKKKNVYKVYPASLSQLYKLLFNYRVSTMLYKDKNNITPQNSFFKKQLN